MITAVDTNVILDIAADDPAYVSDSERLLVQALDSGSLVISEVVYAELAPQYELRESLDAALGELGISVAGSDADIAWLAGRRWAEYRAAGGTRQRLLADFLIGAHAVLRAECLLTRDRGFYKTYFPELRLMRVAEG
ncbi:MAG: PIN domain-containing protein [Armatimonadetes bacterium]|nr:PIN domain-containing protein [Armatimonadota bacterium]